MTTSIRDTCTRSSLVIPILLVNNPSKRLWKKPVDLGNPWSFLRHLRRHYSPNLRTKKMSELVKAILKITNESPYGWLDIDSVEAKQIELLIIEFKTKER